ATSAARSTPAEAAAAATAAATSAGESAAGTRTRAAGLLLRFVDLERAAFEVATIERRDRRLRVAPRAHRHERESARLAGHPVGHDRHFGDLPAILFEHRANRIFDC